MALWDTTTAVTPPLQTQSHASSCVRIVHITNRTLQFRFQQFN